MIRLLVIFMIEKNSKTLTILSPKLYPLRLIQPINMNAKTKPCLHCKTFF